MRQKLGVGLARTAVACALVWNVPAGATVAKRAATSLDQKQFSIDELSFGSPNSALEDVVERLPNRAAWQEALRRSAASGAAPTVFVDLRSGVATNILSAVPLLPGDGAGNHVDLPALSKRLGRPLAAIDVAAVSDAVLAHVRANRDLLGIDVEQLGPALTTPVTPELWQISIAQQQGGIPVRFARVSATVSHGNLVSMGARTWGNVVLDTRAQVSAVRAIEAGFTYAEGRMPEDIVTEPRLEIVPVAPPEHQSAKRFDGTIGQGYRHRLVWTFEFTRPPESARWEVTVDAHSGQVLAFGDVNHYASRKRAITGGVYPLANTGTCTDVATCGAMQSATPMPFADVADSPETRRFANSAGIYDYLGGTTTTHLRGVRLYNVTDTCGDLVKSSPAGGLALGGLNGQHDCATGGSSSGNTAAARTTYYEVNKISEIAAGYLPGNTYIRGFPPDPSQIFFEFSAQTNLRDTCNAFYQPRAGNAGRLGFFRSGGGCRNTGEIADVIDHEWGHFLDDHDANMRIDSTGEGYADIASIYRTQQSCQGPGFFVTNSDGCGASPDGTGVNTNEAAPLGSYCTTSCSGVRDSDWVKHIPSFPADPLGFVCSQCRDVAFGFGPCGKEPHCGGAPVSQAAWDFVARDLLAPPHNLDSQSAFIVGNKLFYQGSQNVGEWFACECGVSANGCSTDSGYMQWLFADDDNGNPQDGTPHMSAIFDAFNRHGIACSSPTPRNAGCESGPTAVPNVSATPGAFSVSLAWTAVPNATRYWVYRTEGYAGCNYGKALIAEVTGLAYVDAEVAAGRPYYYNVVAAGADSACFGPVSPCVSATPGTGTFALSCSPGSLNIPGGPISTTCSVVASGGFAGEVELGCTGLPSLASCQFDPATVTLAANGTATSQLHVLRGLTPNGTYSFKVQGTPPVTALSTHETSLSLAISGAADGDLLGAFDPALGAPSCGAAIGRSCDTGPALVRFRDGRGPETHQPNTLGGTCRDGNALVLDGNGSNDRIRVATADNTPFAPGKKVVVSANVQTRTDFAHDAADFFFAADATHPVWQLIGTVVPEAAGAQELYVKYLLPEGGLQAVRVQFRRQGSPVCSQNSVNDADDLVFAVGP